MNRITDNSEKIAWWGTIISIQPRTRVWRYVTDNRTHYHIGYNLFLDGTANGITGRFSVAISEKQMQTGGFIIGKLLQGTAWTKLYPEREYADYYRAGSLKCIGESPDTLPTSTPPWIMSPPDLLTYEERGARMLSRSCWKGKCFPCIV